MHDLPLTMACWGYDRARTLFTGQIRPDGIRLTCLDLPVEETFFRMLRHREFDVAEMSLSSYVLSCFREDRPFVAIPVFPSRAFRHSGIFVHAGAGIREPRDLVGRRVGVPEYQLTAVVWIRGILEEHYGVPHDSVTYCVGGQEQPGRPEKAPLTLPPRIRLERIGPDDTLSDMLARGAIDALYAPREPSTLASRPTDVRRLFPEHKAAEQEYYRHTGIFPIMHTLVIRREVYEQHRWVAQSLLKAWDAAKADLQRRLRDTSAPIAMLPWLVSHVEEARRELGDDFWPYGLEPNRRALETFLGYSYAQGLAPSRLTPEALFAPESLEAFRI